MSSQDLLTLNAISAWSMASGLIQFTVMSSYPATARPVSWKAAAGVAGWTRHWVCPISRDGVIETEATDAGADGDAGLN